MTNLETIRAVTTNLKSLLKGQGINFTEKVYKDKKNINAGSVPAGSIFYKGESFEHGYGAKAYYVNARFAASVTLKNRSEAELIRQEQIWVHKIREALTVDGLNVDDLSEGKPVTRVIVSTVDIKNDNSSGIAEVNFEIVIRYREN